MNPEQFRYQQRLQANADYAIATQGGRGRLSSFGLSVDPASQLAMVPFRPALSNILADDNPHIRAMHAQVMDAIRVRAQGHECHYCFHMETPTGSRGHHPNAGPHSTRTCLCPGNSKGPRAAAPRHAAAPLPAYGAHAGYGAPPPGYHAPPAALPLPAYAPHPAYGAPLPAYGAPHAAGYGAPHAAGYAAPAPAAAPAAAPMMHHHVAPAPAAAPVMHHRMAVAALPVCQHGQLGCKRTDLLHWQTTQHH